MTTAKQMALCGYRTSCRASDACRQPVSLPTVHPLGAAPIALVHGMGLAVFSYLTFPASERGGWKSTAMCMHASGVLHNTLRVYGECE